MEPVGAEHKAFAFLKMALSTYSSPMSPWARALRFYNGIDPLLDFALR